MKIVDTKPSLDGDNNTGKVKMPQLCSGQDPRGPGRVRAGGERHQPDLHRAVHPRAA